MGNYEMHFIFTHAEVQSKVVNVYICVFIYMYVYIHLVQSYKFSFIIISFNILHPKT